MVVWVVWEGDSALYRLLFRKKTGESFVKKVLTRPWLGYQVV
jgi:hypothetical protein